MKKGADKVDYPPYVSIVSIQDPALADVPAIERFQELQQGERVVKDYHIRIRKPKFPWLVFLVGLVLYILPGVLVILWHFLGRRRGHTFLYLTTKRVIIVELSEASFGRDQTVLNYNIEHVSGFTLFAQRGIRKFLAFITLREKRTFFISIVTRSVASFALGARSTRGSEFEPGRDAVALCSELDGTLLAIRSGTVS